MFICFLVDSVSTLFFAAYRCIYIHVTDESYKAPRQIFGSPQRVLLIQHESVPEQLGLLQCQGLPCRSEYVAELRSAVRLLFQPTALGFQCTSIVNRNTLKHIGALFSGFSFPAVSNILTLYSPCQSTDAL